MKIPEQPWIVLAAERLIELERAHLRAKGEGRYAANGSDEHVAYVHALCGAFASEGLSLHEFDICGQPVTADTHVFLKKYGTEAQCEAVMCRILRTAVHLLLE
ncbi:hypothetical protein K1Y78_42495 [Streptomyces sp. tea 10]|nr:hypothetical protein [Streptomyces sp. tea 10]